LCANRQLLPSPGRSPLLFILANQSDPSWVATSPTLYDLSEDQMPASLSIPRSLITSLQMFFNKVMSAGSLLVLRRSASPKRMSLNRLASRFRRAMSWLIWALHFAQADSSIIGPIL
jgi:hypothetical protein